jgi:hypothetical protein
MSEPLLADGDGARQQSVERVSYSLLQVEGLLVEQRNYVYTSKACYLIGCASSVVRYANKQTKSSALNLIVCTLLVVVY